MSIAHFKTDEELVEFAREFFANRVETFRKDIAICVTSNADGEHAYFPALIICIAFADLLSGLYAGTLRDQKLKELKVYAANFMKPEYTSDHCRLEILYECLRHKVAHLAYPYAVFDTATATSKTFRGQPRRRVTWTIHEAERRPAIAIIDYLPCILRLVKTPTPWPVSYDCRIEVSVRSLEIDIVGSIDAYLRHLQSDRVARECFAKCMREYFPR
jgi:hypothetical protein